MSGNVVLDAERRITGFVLTCDDCGRMLDVDVGDDILEILARYEWRVGGNAYIRTHYCPSCPSPLDAVKASVLKKQQRRRHSRLKKAAAP